MQGSAEGALRSWEQLLNPIKLRQNLVRASVFLAAYELLQTVVKGRPKAFFLVDVVDDPGPGYKGKVLRLHKDKFLASCLWLKSLDAIDADDLKTLARIRRHRNEVAHELFQIVSGADREVQRGLLIDLMKIVAKIDQWWLREMELDEEDGFGDLHEIPDEEITSGNMMLLSMMLSMFDGDDSLLRDLHAALMEAQPAIKRKASR